MSFITNLVFEKKIQQRKMTEHNRLILKFISVAKNNIMRCLLMNMWNDVKERNPWQWNKK